MKYWLIFCNQAPEGIIVRDQDVKHWKDASSYMVEVDEEMIDLLNEAIEDNDIQRLPIGQANERM